MRAHDCTTIRLRSGGCVHKTSRSTNGIALISVLWVLALLSILAAGVGATARSETRLVSTLVDVTKVRYVAEGAIDLAVAKLRAPGTAKWPADGTIQHAEIAGVDVQIAIHDEGGKVDLNMAPPHIIQQLLAAAGVDNEQQSMLTDAILDWRDTDQLRRINGAERSDYAAQGLNNRPANRHFQTIDELRLVLGMEPQLYARLATAVTIFTGQSSVNLLVAPPLVKAAFANGARLPAYSGSSDSAYSIDILARNKTGVEVRLGVVIITTLRGARVPFKTVAWHEGGRNSAFEKPDDQFLPATGSGEYYD